MADCSCALLKPFLGLCQSPCFTSRQHPRPMAFPMSTCWSCFGAASGQRGDEHAGLRGRLPAPPPPKPYRMGSLGGASGLKGGPNPELVSLLDALSAALWHLPRFRDSLLAIKARARAFPPSVSLCAQGGRRDAVGKGLFASGDGLEPVVLAFPAAIACWCTCASGSSTCACLP